MSKCITYAAIATLTLALTIAIIAGPLANIALVKAADVTTYAFLSVFPNPVQVGNTVVVSMSVQPLQPSSYDFYEGFTATITKPDGTAETKGPFTTDATGSQWFNYVPTVVGTYSFKFSFPGQTFADRGDYYKPVESPVTTLVVQQEPIPGYPTVPLPTDYWTRPIYAENREWSSISGNWLKDSYDSAINVGYCTATGYNPYSEAPMTAHVAWTRELLLGGLVGGQSAGTSYYTLNDYEMSLFPPIIINGRLYYNYHESDFRNPIRPGFVCLDLRTGEELWRNTEGNIHVGQLFDYHSGNQNGATPWLWDIGANTMLGGMHMPCTYKMYDAFTGELIVGFDNAIQGGFPTFGDDGSLLIYFIDGVNNWLAMWNSTQAFVANGLIYFSGSGEGFLRPSQPWGFLPNVEGMYDWNTGIQWNVTTPDVPDYPDLEYGGTLGQTMVSIQNGVILATVESFSASYHEIGYDAKTGQRLWIHNTTQWTWSRAFGEGYYSDFYSPTMTQIGYDIKTGNRLWQTDPQGYPWGLYQGSNSLIADGKVITIVYDGYVYAYDVKTGDTLWKHFSENTTETPYGHYAFYYGPMMAKGVVFAGTGEHSPSQPLIRGNKLHAINASTGEGIWTINGLYNLAAVADGYLLAANGYDNKIYCFGKGPSTTTVTAPKTQVTLGESLVIEGNVLDKSTGQLDTPCISDEDMSAWMEYVHMQKPIPTNAKGVEVSLAVIDANNNFRNIGTATSDVGGVYSLVWKPDISGKYTVIATFAGSDSYGSSSARTNFFVEEAVSAATPEPTQAPASMADIYFLPMSIGMIAAIAIVGIALALLLRKR